MAGFEKLSFSGFSPGGEHAVIGKIYPAGRARADYEQRSGGDGGDYRPAAETAARLRRGGGREPGPYPGRGVFGQLYAFNRPLEFILHRKSPFPEVPGPF